MAEFTSSIITIANVSLVVIEKTIKYIKEINLVNSTIKDLLVKLKDLHRLIGVVASTYKQVGPSDESPGSRLVGQMLSSCQKRMDKLRLLVSKLAALESDTWFQKMSVKKQLDRVKKNIESLIKDMHSDMECMNTGMSCWSLHVSSANRQISEAIAAQQGITVRANTQDLAHGDVSPVMRTLSEAATVFGDDPGLQLRQYPTGVSSHSRISISSTSSRAMMAPSDCSNSIASIVGSALVNSKSDSEDFHFQITKCGGNQERIQKIRDLLQRHSDGSMLARSTDTWHRTPLHVAAQRGDVELARILVTFGADVNAKDSEPSSVLDHAVAGRHRSLVRFLLDQGVDEDAVLSRNRAKLKEMKRTIQFEKQVVRQKSRTCSLNTQSGVVM